MAHIIQIKRGLETNLPTLASGELGWTTDTKKCFIGDGTTNHEFLVDSAGGMTWSTKTANYTAVANDGIFADTNSSAFTVTLPATPTLGDSVSIDDVSGSFATNNLTVGRNGEKINNVASDPVFDEDSIRANFIYSGSTYGWRYTIERLIIVAS